MFSNDLLETESHGPLLASTTHSVHRNYTGLHRDEGTANSTEYTLLGSRLPGPAAAVESVEEQERKVQGTEEVT